ncbi:MAG: oligosaccharide repeat unit polymerase [Rhodobacteraceae bacterium]|nr:oligosaccharide repeat unit polymerase [Paracoccaceae bacterium]
MNFLIIYCSLWLVVYRMNGAPVVRMDVIFTIMLLVMALGSLNPFLIYPFTPSIEVVFLIFSGHLSFCLGFLLLSTITGRRWGLRELNIQDHFLFLFLTYAAVIFSIAVLSMTVISGSIPFLSRFYELASARTAHWETAFSVSVGDRVLNLMSYFAFIYVVAFPYARKNMQGSLLVFFFALLSLIDFALQKGGRSLIVFAAIGFFAVYIVVFRPKISFFFWSISFFALLFYVLGAEFYLSRNPAFVAAPDLFLRHNCAGASFSDVGRGLPNGLKSLVLSSCYFSSPPYFFEIFMQQGAMSNFVLGAYNFSIFGSNAFISIREEINLLFAQESLGGNPWSTFARDMYIDFGYFSFLFLFALGSFFGWYSALFSTQSYSGVARLGVVICFSFFLPFISPLIIRPIIYSIIFLLVFPVFFSAFFRLVGVGYGSRG